MPEVKAWAVRVRPPASVFRAKAVADKVVKICEADMIGIYPDPDGDIYVLFGSKYTAREYSAKLKSANVNASIPNGKAECFFDAKQLSPEYQKQLKRSHSSLLNEEDIQILMDAEHAQELIKSAKSAAANAKNAAAHLRTLNAEQQTTIAALKEQLLRKEAEHDAAIAEKDRIIRKLERTIKEMEAAQDDEKKVR